jgi:arsenate reductase
MITIYHNPRCSKSRECLLFPGLSGKEVEIINYMKTPFSVESLSEIINLLGIEPINLVRTNEKIWKEKFKGRKMKDATIIKAMVENPSLIQRPIVINGKKAVIARPLEKMIEII